MFRSTTGNCVYCGRKSDFLVDKFCSPVCESQHSIYGSKLRNAEKQKKSRKCAECGKTYRAHQERQKFCSAICRSRFYNKAHHKPCLRKECMICNPPIEHRPFIEETKKDLFQ